MFTEFVFGEWHTGYWKMYTKITHTCTYIDSNNNLNQQMAQCSLNHSECKGFVNEFS